MNLEPYAEPASKLFESITQIAKLVPTFGERRKKEIDIEVGLLIKLEFDLKNKAVAFNIGSRIDELLGLSDAVLKQTKNIESKFKIYAKELQAEKTKVK